MFTPETKQNLGGPSAEKPLTKHSSGYTTENVIISPLIRKSYDHAVHSYSVITDSILTDCQSS